MTQAKTKEAAHGGTECSWVPIWEYLYVRMMVGAKNA